MNIISSSKRSEDKWVRTTCTGCYGNCAVRVHVIDGIAVKVEGDPTSVMGSQGGVCAKSASMIQLHYHPKRFNYPLKRMNPNKGIGTDPKWKRISWDEALGDITERLQKIRNDNPAKFVMVSGPGSYPMLQAVLMPLFAMPYGGYHGMFGMGLHCGNASHLVAGMNHASWDIIPDYDRCNYVIQFGSNMGGGTGHSSAIAMMKAAQARARGMKTVVFDPMCNYMSGKANEWYPLRPATDLAIALAMANVIANDVKIYDKDYLKKFTNGPYLVKNNGEYLRDDVNGEPLLWDIQANKAKSWNDTTLGDVALEGVYTIKDEKYTTVFSLTKDHLKQYSPDWAEEISTVKAHAIKRIATDFANEAKIGSTITIQGVQLPYRPVSVVSFRGLEGHTNGLHSFMAVDLLNHLVGNGERPGGSLGWAVRSLGHPDTANPRFSPYPAKDGFIRSSAWTAGIPATWPHAEPKLPTRPDLVELFPLVVSSAAGLTLNAEDIWKKFDVPAYEAAFIQFANPLMTAANKQVTEKRFKNMFIVAFPIVPNETTEAVADYILPDYSPLELTDAIEADQTYHFNYPMGMLDWEFHPHIAPVKPSYERRYVGEVYLDLLNRLGLRKRANEFIAKTLSTVGDPPHIEPEEQFTSWEELSDRVLKRRFGEERGLEWFKEHGFIKWPKKVEEVYWRPYVGARSTIYNEWLLEYRDQIKDICEERDLHLDWEQYTPLISYFPSVINKRHDDEFDMYCFGYRDILHNASATQEVPWLFEVSEMNPFTFNACMNTKTAKEKGIQNGDIVYIENKTGQKTRAKVHIIEGIHPEAIAMTHGSGHWLDGHPAKGRGGLLNEILEVDWEHFCPITQNIETSARVKIYKETTK
jgi:anaerobic selenocysteine-containing dehydrogenase